MQKLSKWLKFENFETVETLKELKELWTSDFEVQRTSARKT